MWVGTIGSARGYEEEVREHRALLLPIVLVSVVGRADRRAAACCVTPPTVFERLIPWLLLFATVLFALSPLLRGRRRAPRHAPWQLVVQFFVAIYGGYFGAGMGIMMLAVLAFSRLADVSTRRTRSKTCSRCSINGVALVPFILARIVDWRFAVPMAVVALVGGYFGARFFRRVPQPISRSLVIADRRRDDGRLFRPDGLGGTA